MIFLFAIGACVGSFLNVVIYRLPRDMSIVRPGSRCCSCSRPIAWYDNIPIASWFILGGKCRHCGGQFSIKYALLELLTALLFVGLYWAYFELGVREFMPEFTDGGWAVYLGHVVLICVLLASSLIDRSHWIIPLSVSYTAVVTGLILSAIWPYLLPNELVASGDLWQIVPYSTPKTAAMAVGAAIGLLAGWAMLKFGLITRSFAEWQKAMDRAEAAGEPEPKIDVNVNINIRREMVRESAFLAPVILGGLAAGWLLGSAAGPAGLWWQNLIIQQKWLAGLLGSVFGFIIAAGVVWATRILGSLAFGKEAMGLGDVHLMAAVGAVLGWFSPTVAFFVAPFFGLGIAIVLLVTRRRREIWYGPFLSLATLTVMLLHDPILEYFTEALRNVTPPP